MFLGSYSSQCSGELPLLPPVWELPHHGLQRLHAKDPGPGGGPASLHAARTSGTATTRSVHLPSHRESSLNMVRFISSSTTTPLGLFSIKVSGEASTLYSSFGALRLTVGPENEPRLIWVLLHYNMIVILQKRCNWIATLGPTCIRTFNKHRK